MRSLIGMRFRALAEGGQLKIYDETAKRALPAVALDRGN
jgi:hypothetical protein